MTANDQPAASSLCTRCGLCCNGALFDYGPLTPEEVPVARGIGMTLLEGEGQFGFGLPCPLLDGACCRSYESRPHTCRAYACKLLRAVEAGDIVPDEALAIIADTLAARDMMLEALPPGASIPDARRWRREARAAGATPEPMAPPQVMIALGMLDLQLDQHFRKASERQIMPRG